VIDKTGTLSLYEAMIVPQSSPFVHTPRPIIKRESIARWLCAGRSILVGVRVQ